MIGTARVLAKYKTAIILFVLILLFNKEFAMKAASTVLTQVSIKDKNIISSGSNETISEIYHRITTDEELRDVTEAYRGAESTEDKEALAEQMPAYMVSGDFKTLKRRNPKEPSNLVKIIIRRPDLLNDKQKLILRDSHNTLVSETPDGDGYQILVPTDVNINNDKKYRETYSRVESSYRRTYNIDPSTSPDVPGIVNTGVTDIRTLIVICHDEKATYNEKAVAFTEEELNAVTVLKSYSNEEDLDPADEQYRSDVEKLAINIIQRNIDNIRNSQEGERNPTLNKSTFTVAGIWKAYSFTFKSIFDEKSLRKKLLEAALECGLEEKEATATIDSAWISGENKPFKLFMLGNKPKVKPILDYETLKEYLDINFLTPYYDEVAHKVVCPRYSQNCGDNITDLANCMFPDLAKVFNIQGSRQWIMDMLYLIGKETHKNIVVEELEKLKDKWDGKDHFSEIICNLLGVKKGSLAYTFYKKFFIQAMFMIHNELQYKRNHECQLYNPEFVLLLAGRQGIGKTRSFRYILRFSTAFSQDDQRLYKEGGKFTSRDKDDRRRLLQGFVVEIGEVQTTFRQSDMEDLKAFLTQNYDSYRLPYGREDTETPRITSFVATANTTGDSDDLKGSDLLRDRSGNRRFAIVYFRKVFQFEKVSFDEIRQMWAQLYNTYWVDEKIRATIPFRLTPKEKALQELNNETATAGRKGDSEIEDILLVSINDKRWELMTSSEFLSDHKSDLPSTISPDSIGSTLSKIGIKTKGTSRKRYLPTNVAGNGCERSDIRAVVSNLDVSRAYFYDSNEIIVDKFPDMEENESMPDYVERLRNYALNNDVSYSEPVEMQTVDESVSEAALEIKQEPKRDEDEDFDLSSLHEILNKASFGK